MDFSKNTVLKENYSFFVGDANGFVTGGEHGLYNRDTRFLSRYEWVLPDAFQTLLSHSPRPDKLTLHHAELDAHRQRLALKRQLVISATDLSDTLTLENTDLKARSLRLELRLEVDFADLFEARGWHPSARTVSKEVGTQTCRFSYDAEDGATMALEVEVSHPFTVKGNRLVLEVVVPAKAALELKIVCSTENPFETGPVSPVTYERWSEKVNPRVERADEQKALDRAVADLRALLLFDEHGTIPAAGIPWFVAAFGRDALLTAYLLLPHAPDLAKSSLRYLAHYQAQETDAFRNAQPGKILHEMRYGELSRTNKTPHSPYYGTVDATPLFIVLLRELYRTTSDLDFVREMQPHWEAGLNWMQTYGDLDGDGFLEFKGAEGEGLSVQSWKDSGDSLSHADGALARGAIAVSEVQGYAYAAYRAVAAFYSDLGEKAKAQSWLEQAATLKSKFHAAFWLDDLQTYALALDGEKCPLRVQNSDAGHLLWSAIVPEDTASKLVQTLMGEANWSGWGVRTLGKNEARYNPVSYHNGSVWPHDNALIAAGMAHYGFLDEAKRIARATFAIALSQHDLRLPELVGGYERSAAPPVPYPTACRPQAWDAAALVYLARFL